VSLLSRCAGRSCKVGHQDRDGRDLHPPLSDATR
jgi:hypothetical protein